MVRYICEGCADEMISEEQYLNQKKMCDMCYEKYLNKSIPHIKKKEKKRHFKDQLKELKQKMAKRSSG
jgi:hypothetical protein